MFYKKFDSMDSVVAAINEMINDDNIDVIRKYDRILINTKIIDQKIISEFNDILNSEVESLSTIKNLLEIKIESNIFDYSTEKRYQKLLHFNTATLSILDCNSCFYKLRSTGDRNISSLRSFKKLKEFIKLTVNKIQETQLKTVFNENDKNKITQILKFTNDAFALLSEFYDFKKIEIKIQKNNLYSFNINEMRVIDRTDGTSPNVSINLKVNYKPKYDVVYNVMKYLNYENILDELKMNNCDDNSELAITKHLPLIFYKNSTESLEFDNNVIIEYLSLITEGFKVIPDDVYRCFRSYDQKLELNDVLKVFFDKTIDKRITNTFDYCVNSRLNDFMIHNSNSEKFGSALKALNRSVKNIFYVISKHERKERFHSKILLIK